LISAPIDIIICFLESVGIKVIIRAINGHLIIVKAQCQYYKKQDISGKRYIIDHLTPSSINSNTGNIESLNINSALSKIFDLQSIKIHHIKNKIPAIVASKGVKIDQAIKALKRNGIIVNEDQAKVILDFLYLLAKICYKSNSTAA
jgi:site-specific DNA recombinase